jgi:beta-lactamase regulating signal transducer with metallopeptidase domain
MNPPIQAWMQVTGWTLIHFVWQGGLLAVATAAGLRLSRRRAPEVRYAIACLGLTAMLAAPAITAAMSLAPVFAPISGGSATGPVSAPEGSSITLKAASEQSSSKASDVTGARIALDDWLPAVVWGWLAGVMFLLTRFAGGSWRVYRLRRASLAEALSPWQSTAERIGERLRLDVAFRVVESRLVDAPSVIGSIRPVILLPVTALTNLAPLQIEALLAHELAHVRRRDFTVNVLQTLAETLLFFHPAVWWVSSRIREEREHCCDDVAVSVCGEPRAYAMALADLASWRTRAIGLSVGATDGPLLARVRRLLGAPDADEPRPASGLVVLALGMTLVAGVAVQSTSQSVSLSGPVAAGESAAIKTTQPLGTWLTRQTDHFEIHYPPELDLHAERVEKEAERAYAHVSADLRHNLAFKVPVVLFRTTAEFEQSVQARRFGPMHTASAAEPARDRILVATDRPADQWYGLLAHEVAHVFGFDILPGSDTLRWITEGLAEYERGEWDPSDLAMLRGSVRANTIPSLSGLHRDDGTTDARLIYGLGHAAFDFIESRWGKSGLRQFLFALRQTARNGGDAFESAFQIKRDDFDRAFERYLRERFAGAADQSLVGRFDYRASMRLEGDITAMRAPVAEGLACIELWVPIEGEARQRWGIECGHEPAVDVVRGLKPGDRVIVTGPPAREPAAQRMVVHRLDRPSDGFTWRAQSR